jgi:hypothetical protein
MRTGVTVLADPSMEGRGLGSEGLERAARWVEGRFEEIGLARAGDPDRGYRQSWTWSGGPTGETWALSNLVGRIPGRDPRIEGQPVVLMAHLDHLGRGWPDVKEGFAGLVHPGADDNASGVAALLEVARVLAAEPARARPVLVVVTTGEEARCLGARHLLAGLDAGPQAQDRPMACVNLDSVGRLGEGRPLAIGAGSAREWRHILMGVQATVGVEVTPVLEPMEASDQEACIERGIPGLHLLTGAHADWHRPSDTADKVDFEGMTKVAAVAAEIVAYLADRPDPLNAMTPSGGSPPPGRPPAGGERAALGTIPDFGYTGPGVRVQGTSPGSAAEKAGILAGDIVVALGGRGVDDLRGLGDALAAHRPGERVVVEVLRGGNPKRFDVVIEKR